MCDERDSLSEQKARWIRIGFVASFFLPTAYMVLVLFPFDQGAAATDHHVRIVLHAGGAGALATSLLTPLAIIIMSKQKMTAKVGQILLAVIAWIVVQIFAFVIIVVASFMHSGLEGIQ